MIGILCLLATLLASQPVIAYGARPSIPPYDHIVVVIIENRDYDEIIGNRDAPNLNRLAQTYGSATSFYAEVHPSLGNYIAILGGDTFGIHDNDAWYCRPGSNEHECPSAHENTQYVDHTLRARSLIDQLNEHGLTWKGYFESIPTPGSKAISYPNKQDSIAGQPNGLYASRHNGFLNFKTVHDDTQLASKLVGFDQLKRDLASGQLPNYAQIVPNQCNNMHGLKGPNVPDDCSAKTGDRRIARSDKAVGDLIAEIEQSPVWSAAGNMAIIITWDEDSKPIFKWKVQGCCGFDPASQANFGGGHIATIVITNHGPRGVIDATPYNHYSLLRTVEEAFGIGEYLGHAGETELGVQSMTPLFRRQQD